MMREYYPTHYFDTWNLLFSADRTVISLQCSQKFTETLLGDIEITEILEMVEVEATFV